jgi:hypothetical protein
MHTDRPAHNVTAKSKMRSMKESGMLTKVKRVVAGAALIAVAGLPSAAYAAVPRHNAVNQSQITIIKSVDPPSPK